MPVLGGSVTGTFKRGIFVPDGALDAWRTARALHASQLVEAVFLGDSTTLGTSASGTVYSYVSKVRSLSTAAGYTDGGSGLQVITDTVNDGITPLVSGSPVGGSFEGPVGYSGFSISGTQSITLAFKGTRVRIVNARLGDSGSFTYNINGVGAVTVPSSTDSTMGSTLVTGLPGGGATNQIVLTNVSGTNRMVLELLKDVGIVYHRHSAGGANFGNWVGPDVSYAALVTPTNWAFGLKMGEDLSGKPAVVPWAASRATSASTRKPSLIVIKLGVNDLGSLDGGTLTEANLMFSVLKLFRLARASGASVIACLPPMEMHGSYSAWGGILGRCIESAALTTGCALVDLAEAYGPFTDWTTNGYVAPTNNVHPYPAGYDQEATWLWNNVLST